MKELEREVDHIINAAHQFLREDITNLAQAYANKCVEEERKRLGLFSKPLGERSGDDKGYLKA